MSSEVPLLTTDEKFALRDRWKSHSVQTGAIDLIELVEQAVRAQWAAEVAMLQTEVQARIENEASACNYAAQFKAERDSAQAEAKALRSALEQIGDWRLHMYGNDDFFAVKAIACKALAEIDRAALQPGASQAPRAGETA